LIGIAAGRAAGMDSNPLRLRFISPGFIPEKIPSLVKPGFRGFLSQEEAFFS
jgi:hypothetical protein